MTSHRNKVYAITGAASGIGHAIAIHLAQLGARLAVTDLSQLGLDALTTELEPIIGKTNILARRADICDRSAVESWLAATGAHFGRLDGAINTAGAHPRESGQQPIWNVTDEDWEFAQRVNVQGTLNLVRAALRHMVDAVGRQEISTGSVIVFGSNSSVTGAPNLSAYTTSKHAVLGIMRSAAMDAAPYGIRVNAVCPGPIDIPMLRNAVSESLMKTLVNSIPMKKVGSTKEVVGLVTYLLDQSSGFTTGSVHMVDGGMTAA
ncbi:short chain dehydrogenase [Aspergillus violaceofuscus CBS 115571]|uniref:Short chain dehydrogenase n=1 Tax=Aspergillus violaceofuscus (strain CBS 115571) TaxID=1450538 RepID=A0A2V5GT70_ASPV1|nr:short chain dehydrogenase [Aspergillus violaceofuscus CBS 115571]